MVDEKEAKVYSMVDSKEGVADNPIGDILKRFKQAFGAETDEVLGRYLGVSRQMISKARNEKKVPPAWFFEAIARVHASIDWLLTGRGPMKITSKTSGVSEMPTPYGPRSLDEPLLFHIIQTIEEALSENGLMLAPDKKADLILTAYDLSSGKPKRQLDKAAVLRLIKLAT